MLPNVSAIYRDLACIADPQPPRNYPPTNQQSLPHNLYADKQARHNQLMEKLRNSQQ